MFGPWVEVWRWLRPSFPKFEKGGISKPNFRNLRKPHFNFITLHYIYIIFMSILASVIIYGPGGMPYVDALFFGSGAATQSGLNTIDVNKLYLSQQLTLMLVASVCNPIVINTFVVFVRLYWFEKRFQHVAAEARHVRRTRERSRTMSEARRDIDNDLEERGVTKREINIVLGETDNNKWPNQYGKDGTTERDAEPSSGTSSSSSQEEHESPGEKIFDPTLGKFVSPPSPTSQPAAPSAEQPLPFRRDIVFADEVSRTDTEKEETSNLERLPQPMSAEQHIAIVEAQRNPKDKGVLRIPGPRDFDRGDTIQRVDEDEKSDLNRVVSHESTSEPEPHQFLRNQRTTSIDEEGDAPKKSSSDDHPLKRNITFDQPAHPRRNSKAGWSAFSFNKRTATAGTGDDAALGIRQRQRTRTFASFVTNRSQEKDPMPYLSWTPTIGRNSQFVDLTEEQREELGGIEYRSLKTLAIVLIIYYVGFHLLGMVCLLPWINHSRYVPYLHEQGVDPDFWGVFTPSSLFNDLGFTLTADSMVTFQRAVFPLLLGSFLIIIGNTGFPCMLRFIIWLASLVTPVGSGVWEELKFLLDHPRRCFTLLFPSKATWWLFWVLIILNLTDLLFFIVLDINDPTVTDLPVGVRILVGWFQAASTRTAGFAVINLAELHPAIQVSYLIMMYISIFPIAISLRRTNVYEEKSLGIFHSAEAEEPAAANGKEQSYVSQHLRRQLSFDLWYVFLGFFLIAIIEGSRLENVKGDEAYFTLFSILFEIVSAYGTVGLSLGFPGFNTSFSGQFHTLSKLVIIAMEIRGRHRGLPYALDRAILLPSESLQQKEVEDANRRAQMRRSSIMSQMVPPPPVGDMTGSSLQREASANPTVAHSGRRMSGTNLSRFLSGALNAGPTIPKDKRT